MQQPARKVRSWCKLPFDRSHNGEAGDITDLAVRTSRAACMDKKKRREKEGPRRQKGPAVYCSADDGHATRITRTQSHQHTTHAFCFRSVPLIPRLSMKAAGASCGEEVTKPPKGPAGAHRVTSSTVRVRVGHAKTCFGVLISRISAVLPECGFLPFKMRSGR
ncbi:pyrroline-5-carboxylate reductase [Pseudozyma hubeiensis SY62]|uniref:Pyrroline-5-carboxylate reductase n=1 Tax=Pseudozyma hubeiensis (strain SY62) TaxID=1305764 RepID=R9PDE5_PSEHS|nr:pyrroline-5-carboxylate reductase [Pseudozyma hubeiensis SY62]GAC99361.1 pyrroline-5-carboxylate reductase [Pseudozyma hubeiensis SY62]